MAGVWVTGLIIWMFSLRFGCFRCGLDVVAAVWMFLLRFLGIGAQPWRRLPGGPRATRCVVPSVTAAGRPDRRRRYIHVSTPPDASLPAGISWPSASTSALRIVLQPPPGLCPLQSFFVAFKGPTDNQPSVHATVPTWNLIPISFGLTGDTRTGNLQR